MLLQHDKGQHEGRKKKEKKAYTALREKNERRTACRMNRLKRQHAQAHLHMGMKRSSVRNQ